MSAPGAAIVSQRALTAAATGEALLVVLEQTRGNHVAAAALLGCSVDTLRRRLTAAGHTAASLRRRWPIGDRQPARERPTVAARTAKKNRRRPDE